MTAITFFLKKYIYHIFIGLIILYGLYYITSSDVISTSQTAENTPNICFDASTFKLPQGRLYRKTFIQQDTTIKYYFVIESDEKYLIKETTKYNYSLFKAKDCFE